MRSRNFVIGLVASVATIALALGLLLVTDSVAGEDVELPDRVGDLRAIDTPGAYPDGEVPDQVEDRQRTADEVNADGYSDAFDDAAADSRVYVEPETDDAPLVSVVAVAADTGPLLPQDGFVDPEQQGFAVAQAELVDDGEVECLLLRNAPPRAGSDFQPDQAAPDAVFCQRRSGTLTVRARAATSDQALLVSVVEDLWDELG